MPPWLNGWQRSVRRRASHAPRAGPCRETASSAYSLQLGEKRQALGMSGRRTTWYSRMPARRMLAVSRNTGPGAGAGPLASADC